MNFQCGMVYVYNENGEIKFKDGLDSSYYTQKEPDLLETVFEDGVLKRNQTLSEIWKELHG